MPELAITASKHHRTSGRLGAGVDLKGLNNPVTVYERGPPVGIRLEELLARLPSDTQERVARTKDRFNNNVREALRQETGMRLNRDSQAGPGESVNVPITLIPGLPLVLRQKGPLPDDAQRVAILAPYTQVLRELRDGCDVVNQAKQEWQRDSLLHHILSKNETAVQATRDLAEELLKESQRINLVQWILEVDEDVLGVYRSAPGRNGEKEGVELFWGVIGLIARWLAVPVEDLTLVVLAHELAHAYTHLGSDIDGYRWQTPSFRISAHEIKEGLAQYYTVRVLNRLQMLGEGPLKAYERLLPHQPPAYQVHVPWLHDQTPEMVRAAMMHVRRLPIPTWPNFLDALMEATAKLRLDKSTGRM
jgi:hypothetical protein